MNVQEVEARTDRSGQRIKLGAWYLQQRRTFSHTMSLRERTYFKNLLEGLLTKMSTFQVSES